jgi:hypothetical protein
MIALVPRTKVESLEQLDLMIGALKDIRKHNSPISEGDTVYIGKDVDVSLGRFTDQLKGEAMTVLKVNQVKNVAHCGYSASELANECVYCFIELKYLTKVVESI